MFIVPELKSLSIDESSLVWKSVASNLSKILPKINKSLFSGEMFPILQRLCMDKDSDVRLSSITQVPDIAWEYP